MTVTYFKMVWSPHLRPLLGALLVCLCVRTIICTEKSGIVDEKDSTEKEGINEDSEEIISQLESELRVMKLNKQGRYSGRPTDAIYGKSCNNC